MLRAVGSLWFAAVLLLLLVVGMACATVYESTHSTEQALAVFYKSRWFEWLLGLVAVNVLAAVIIRYPFSKRQIGFVLTHAGILVTLGGACVTGRCGVDGRIGFFEGETVDTLTTGVDALTLVKRSDRQQASIELTARAFAGFRGVERPSAPVLSLGDVTVEVERFLPDSEWARRVVDDLPRNQPAVEVSLSASGEDHPTWLFAGKPESVGDMEAVYRTASTGDELRGLLSPTAESVSDSPGVIKIEYEGSIFEVPLDRGLKEAVPLGDTGTTARVLRYLPHAIVGDNKQLVNASDRPENPAVEVEIAGPSGVEKRLAFAKFPDFQSMHGKTQLEGLKLTFLAPSESSPAVGVEVLRGPEDEVYVRFRPRGAEASVRKLEVGVPAESPWSGMKFTVLRCFEHARVDWTLEPVEPVRQQREPALLLKLSKAEQTSEMWVQKHAPRPVTVDGVAYEATYGDKQVPLGFQLTLNRFNIGYYPGGMRPRSFESHITIADLPTGGMQSHVVSMNHPVKHGGYSFYQSSYKQGGGRTASFLSVSRDPGQPIVFAGYVTMLVGMVVVLGIRVADRRAVEKMRND
ncbi:MAG: cytochrome c biogenesis protein ResB [Planctomycetota bacterium]